MCEDIRTNHIQKNCSFIKYLLLAKHVLHAGDTAKNKMDKNPVHMGLIMQLVQ